MKPDLSVYIIETWDDFVKLQEAVSSLDNVPFVLDVETDSAQEKKAKLFGIGLCWDDTNAFYIPIRSNTRVDWWTQENLNKIYSWVAEQCKKHKLVGHNIIYDVLVFEYNSGIRISDYIYSDTILQKHSLDEERPFGLKENAVRYLGAWADKAQEALYENIKKNGGSVTKDNLEIWKADLDVISEYCGWDVLLTRRLFDIFEPRIKDEGLTDLFYKEEVMPLYQVTIDMKRRGFNIDLAYFENLKSKIAYEIKTLEAAILKDIESDIKEYVDICLHKEYPVSNKGKFPKLYAEHFDIPLPVNKAGTVCTTRKEVLKLWNLKNEHLAYYDWLLGNQTTKQWAVPEFVREVQLVWFFLNNPDHSSVFNLKSNDHIGWLLFQKYGEKPLSKTEGGKPQCNDDFLESVKDKYPFVAKLIDLKKLQKLSSTYIEGLLDRQIDGLVYTSMLQFGTTSGRYSSTNPNLQNIPRLKEDDAGLSPLVLHYTNAIKRGFIAPPGYRIVNADYSALEPRCFADASGDELLREVFRKGEDLYSSIAISAFGITDASADPKAPNYLKIKYPELRQKAKVFALAVVYGAEANRIAQALEIDYVTADQIIESYLDAYPNLRKYMEDCDYHATTKGFVKSPFGRIRHLPQAKEIYSKFGAKLLHNRKWVKAQGLDDTRYKLKNALNNSKNFPIQSTASSVVNRAMIATYRRFREEGLDAWIVVQVHDEITCVARKDQAERAAEILQECMEQTTTLSIPLQAEPQIADNWAESK
jgi:DNA polymerase I-like protein with 3'-5' exonuclease and polymerase domains